MSELPLNGPDLFESEGVEPERDDPEIAGDRELAAVEAEVTVLVAYSRA